MKLWKTFAALVFVGTCATLPDAPAQAQKAINLTAVSGYSPTASWVKIFKEYYIPEVNKRLAEKGEYKINWNEGFSGTIAKPREELAAVETGLADIGIVVTAFHVDRLPLYNVAFVTPFVANDVGLVVRTINKLTEKYPAMKQGWAKSNQIFLGASGSVDNYQVVCKPPIQKLGDFKGKRIVGAGSNLLWLQGLGAVGVQGNLGEFGNNIQTGIADCAMVWAEAAAGFKLYTMAPHYVKADLGAANSFAVTVNQSSWKKLPPAVQKVLQQAAIGYGDALSTYVVSAADKGLKTFESNGGKIIPFTQEQRVQWAKALPNIAQDWAKAADKQGLPGTAILKEYMDTMRANKQPIARHWDRE
jgi:TRAP-type C4-dicarboxylate transport system substrate-binding protein